MWKKERKLGIQVIVLRPFWFSYELQSFDSSQKNVKIESARQMDLSQPNQIIFLMAETRDMRQK